ncbi:apoptosis-associated speck-like protein containing a CARD [Acipenser ruthenus]|uniref:apoptosis-associated speck-like protein containing a CARD n=1 Tax=Acipenser ruthenus TaxID=7906 RepID=UPI00274055D0|nr:apoptosis-associated speck-like protein containing a CARD [Acipenser ruthenus]XP_058873027.1 apoptosis-associated speck-like protein containing a CARD [Acipenser ruthenus]XP_058873028.1 apoptosis-associated speck-like protein containing a CARD [Acipenser ruthenus]
MEKTLKDHLVDTLDDLDEGQFNRFKDKLGETTFQGRKIAKGKLQKATTLEVASLLISTYTKKYAAEITILILRAINEVDLAKELEKKTGAVVNMVGLESPPPHAGVPGEVEEVIEDSVSLLRTHKVRLIEVLSNDHSLVEQEAHSKGLLSDRKYKNIRSINDPSEKIEELLDFIMGKGSGAAQEFIELLRTLKNDFPTLPAELLGVNRN